MAQARQQYNYGAGENKTAHSWTDPSIPGTRERNNNTWQTTMNYAAPTNEVQKKEYHNQQIRTRQFQNRPEQPAAVRQSYQDSDIFGTKAGRETVQPKVANAVQKDQYFRESRTFATSDVMGNKGCALKQGDGDMHHALTTRNEGNWSSQVFAGAKPNEVRRKNLARNDGGKGAYYGDDNEQWNNKRFEHGSNFNRKTQARPQTEEAAATRKMKELYGDSAKYAKNRGDGDLMTAAADWRNPHQTYTNKHERAGNALEDMGQQRKDRKANQLQSNILTHEDEAVRAERNAGFDRSNKRVFAATNASWSAQTGYQKPVNNKHGRGNAWQSRQNQLGSTGVSDVIPQTDYTNHQPMTKKQVDFDNWGHKPDGPPRGATGKKPDQGINSAAVNWLSDAPRKVNQEYQNYGAKTVTQNQLRSDLDQHGFARGNDSTDVDDYYKKKATPITKTPNPNMKEKQRFLSSNTFGSYAHDTYQQTKNYPHEGEVIDIDLSGLPAQCGELDIKQAAGVRHVISASVAQDNIKGTCTGNGRVTVRLQQGESAAQVKSNYARAGFTATLHTSDPRKKPVVTGPAKDVGEHRYFNAKDKKAFEMSTKEKQLA